MGFQVHTGAMMSCSFGAAPSTLVATPKMTTAEFTDAATIMDHKPIANVPPFGMCSSIANPAVASATSAAMGVLTPMPCVPAVPAPWAPGSPTVLIANQPALNDSSKCMCMWAGVISITNPGCTKTQIP